MKITTAYEKIVLHRRAVVRLVIAIREGKKKEILGGFEGPVGQGTKFRSEICGDQRKEREKGRHGGRKDRRGEA